MAILVGPWQRALDGDLAIVPNAQLRVRVLDSVTLATNIFNDPDLAPGHEHANPVQADDEGWFPLIWATSGQQYDIAVLDEDGALVKEFLAQEALGSDSAAFERDFVTSRAQIHGSPSNVTSFEAGPPVGDDIGGKARIGGWDDTQAEEISLDAAATNTTGEFTVNGKKLMGVVQVEATTFTAAATVDIPLANTPTGIRQYLVRVWDLQATQTTALLGRFSFDLGGTYKSGASDYQYSKHIVDNNSASPDLVASTSTGDSKIDLQYALRTTANKGAVVEILIVVTDSLTEHTAVQTRCWSTSRDGSGPAHAATAGEIVGGFGRADHIRLLQTGGTLTGKYSVTALYGLGE